MSTQLLATIRNGKIEPSEPIDLPEGTEIIVTIDSRSEFMLESAQKTAQEVLLDQRFFGLDEVKFQQFVELLDEPPTYHERLHELLTTKAPWQ